MLNPWLQIPASDYEAHMSLPEVAQAQAFSRLMAAALVEYAPDSLAVALRKGKVFYVGTYRSMPGR